MLIGMYLQLMAVKKKNGDLNLTVGFMILIAFIVYEIEHRNCAKLNQLRISSSLSCSHQPLEQSLPLNTLNHVFQLDKHMVGITWISTLIFFSCVWIFRSNWIVFYSIS